MILFVTAFNSLSAQEIVPVSPDKPYFYISTAYVGVSPINQATSDPFYSAGNNLDFSNKTGRIDIGIQLNRDFSFELGYISNDLDLTRKLVIDDLLINVGSESRVRISFYSLKLKHHLPLYKNRFKLNTGLGYALGSSNVDLDVLGPTELRTQANLENTILFKKTTRGLHSGKSNFITFDLGVEFELIKKISLFSNVSVYKGFTDLQEQTYDYNINDTTGLSTISTDGSFIALEFGVKYSFR